MTYCKKRYKYHIKVIEDFMLNCSREYKTYRAPKGYFNTFRKIQKSNADRKKGISIDKKVYTPRVGEELTDILNDYNFNIYKKPFGGKQPIDQQSEEEFQESLDKMDDYIVLAKKEIQFDNEVTSWNNWKKGYTKFQYMLWITPEDHEKAVKKYNEKWGFLSNV